MTGLLLIRFQAGETDLMTRAGIFEPRRRPLFELKGEGLRRELSECELKGEGLRRELSECELKGEGLRGELSECAKARTE